MINYCFKPHIQTWIKSVVIAGISLNYQFQERLEQIQEEGWLSRGGARRKLMLCLLERQGAENNYETQFEMFFCEIQNTFLVTLIMQ